MAKKPIKNKVATLASHEEFEITCNLIAELEAQIRIGSAEMDADIQRVRDRHATKLQPLLDESAALSASAASYATLYRDELLPAGKKSTETAQAVWGFRTDPPSLKTLPKVTWALVTDRMRKKGYEDYITLPAPKPDKDRIKAELSDEQLADLGLVIKQTEQFFVKSKDRTEDKV